MIQSHWPHLAELLYVLPIYLHADMAALLHVGKLLWLAAFYAACRETLDAAWPAARRSFWHSPYFCVCRNGAQRWVLEFLLFSERLFGLALGC